MKKKLLFFIIMTFSLLLMTGCNKKEEPATNGGSTGGNTGGNGDSTPSDNLTAVEKYYFDIERLSTSGLLFKNELHKLLEQSHTTRLSYTPGCWDALEKADEDTNNKNNIICIYSGQSILKSNHVGSAGQAGQWNREHLYPQSKGFKDKNMAAHNDIHLLRAAEYSTNSSRGDTPFGEGDGYYTPRAEVRGDIARALFYVIVRYDEDDYTSYTYDGKTYSDADDLDLELSSGDLKPYNGDYYLENLEILIKWNYEDPVSEDELRRNEVVYSIQGNRNPFVDHNDYLKRLYPDLTADY